ncbi:polyamine ABC transporter substrate-binding protein [Shewanella eurypsychrophilus]|uniref:Putrescine-binding periplasmic protein n=1 Tax=Shewanella eurypsychrophilus TaxID=2593656 RepID=A0ABX6V8V6_9GAMM|nr:MULTISPECIES: polyamine ABC transporter substrate-binding protein [Shewanella]QFU22988.1 extracellular solute-binding protein [Shewanella sp. YLB-09]QPG58274.1 polyamine ABC transporter substrate-binding protein [Shewanella eurypsychrophilus]
MKTQTKILLATLALCSISTSAAENTLNIYNWSDYISEEAIASFEAKTGIKINYDVYDSQELAETKLLVGKTGYDLVVSSGSFLQRQIKVGVFQPLDKTRLKNYHHLDPKVLDIVASFDEGNQHAIPYMWGTTGIGYNIDKVETILGDRAINSWELLFQVETISKFSHCGVAMVDAPSEVVSAMLKYLGKNPNSQDLADLNLVEEHLLEIRPYITYFHSSSYVTDLASGNICLAMGWSGDVFMAANRATEAKNGININYVIPQEGAQGWADTFNITSDAKNVDAAYAFLDHILEPQVIAGISNYVWYANANKDATHYVDTDITSHPGIYPDNKTRENLFTDKGRTLKYERAMNRMWTRVKTGK